MSITAIILLILLIFMILCYAGQSIRLNRLQIENKYLHKLYEQAESIILNHNLK